MSSPAQVRSTDAIEALQPGARPVARSACRTPSTRSTRELRRADDWIEHDRPAHWKKQIHEAEDGVHQAKLELERCLLMTTVDGQRPACREQKAALEQAKARLDYCREKAEVVQQVAAQLSPRHRSSTTAASASCAASLEQDVPNARGRAGEDPAPHRRVPARTAARGVQRPTASAPAARRSTRDARTASPPTRPSPPADRPDDACRTGD